MSILRCKNNHINEWEDFIPAKNEVLIGGFILLNNWMVRSERVDALPKLFVRNLKTNEEEELKISDEEIISPGMSLGQKDRNTDKVLSIILRVLFSMVRICYFLEKGVGYFLFNFLFFNWVAFDVNGEKKCVHMCECMSLCL